MLTVPLLGEAWGISGLVGNPQLSLCPRVPTDGRLRAQAPQGGVPGVGGGSSKTLVLSGVGPLPVT